MTKRLLFFLAFVFIVGTCFSQSDYRRGYIITLTNDTINGYINYKGSFKGLKKCRFKNSKDENYVDYTPDEIKAFRFLDGNLFVAMPLEIENKIVNLFIEQLIEGVVDVYCYSDNNGTHYLISKDDGELIELKSTETKIDEGRTSYIKNKREYIGVLKYLFQDSPSTLKMIDHAVLDPNSLIDVAEHYHNDVCSEYECLIYAKKKLNPQFDFSLFTGYSISTISFWGNDYVKGLNSNFSQSNNLALGISLNVRDPSISERFSLQVETVFQDANYVTDSSEINLSYLKVPFLVKYTYPAKKIKPSLQLGIAYNYWRTFEDEGIAPEIQNKSAIQLRRYQYGFLTGIEFSFKLTKNTSLFVQVRYENYRGKHWNTWTAYGYGTAVPVSESVKSKTQFLSFTGGVKF